MQTYLGNCWPDAVQMQLLKAALEPSMQAKQHWENWVDQMDIDKVDPFSYQMMPKIYKNISKSNIAFSHEGRLKGIYKRHWMHNQLLLSSLVKTTQNWPLFESEKIILTKGSAMCAGFYEDWGVRVLGDLDLLIEKYLMTDFMRHLLNQGFSACDERFVAHALSNGWEGIRHAVAFKSQAVGEPFLFDLHVSPLAEISEIAAHWFNESVQVLCQGVVLHRLSTTDLLFQTCIHGTQYSEVPLLRWIMDAVTLLRKSAHEVDWDKINFQSQKYHLILPMKQALTYLMESFDAPIPVNMLNKMRELPISKVEQHDFKQKNRRVGRFFHIVINLWRQSKRQQLSFLTYLKSFWGLDSYREIPWTMFKKVSVFLIRERDHS